MQYLNKPENVAKMLVRIDLNNFACKISKNKYARFHFESLFYSFL